MRKTFGEKFDVYKFDVYIDRCYYNQTFGDMGVEYVIYFLSVSGPLKTLKKLKENHKIKKYSKNYRQCLTK